MSMCNAMKKLTRRFWLAKSTAVFILAGAGCARPEWAPPPEHSSLGPPPIYRRTPNGLVPEDPKRNDADGSDAAGDTAALNASTEAARNRDDDSASWIEGRYTGTSRELIPVEWAEALSRPGTSQGGAAPLRAEPYYVQGEHTPAGYVRGHYRREGDYTRGEHTPYGYIRGDYRGDGNYTRGEFTPAGYMRGHYRAEPQPFGLPYGGVQTSPTPPPTYSRPIGG